MAGLARVFRHALSSSFYHQPSHLSSKVLHTSTQLCSPAFHLLSFASLAFALVQLYLSNWILSARSSIVASIVTLRAIAVHSLSRQLSRSTPLLHNFQFRTMSNLKRKAATTGNEAEPKKTRANGSIASFFGAAPKPAGAAASPSPAVKFDKARWVEGLTAEQKELLKLEIDTLHDSWLSLLRDDVTSKEFLELKKFLNRETAAGKKWFPPQEDVYSWSRHTPFNEVKVVIVGQDPYHNVNQAHGMAFSVRPPTPAPPSLRNMYIALKKDYPSFVEPANRGGLLIPWADRGVLMLNTCLTVRAHEANSHANRGWERFTQKVIDLVAQKRTRGVVFMAWGTPASKRVQKVDKQRHLVLLSVHPSPLSASRGFFDCGHFKAANAWLITRYGDDGEIDWALKPGNTTKTAIKEAAKEDEAAAAGGETKDTEGAEKDTDKGSQDESSEKANGAAKTNGGSKTKKPEFRDDEDDIDSDDEAALEEALKLAEEQIKS